MNLKLTEYLHCFLHFAWEVSIFSCLLHLFFSLHPYPYSQCAIGQPGLYHPIHIKLIHITTPFSKYFSATCQNFSNGKHKLTPARQGIITISSPKENLFRVIQSNKAGALQQHQNLSPHFTVPKRGPVTTSSLSIPTSSNLIEMPIKVPLVLISCKPTFSLLVALLYHPSCVAKT